MFTATSKCKLRSTPLLNLLLKLVNQRGNGLLQLKNDTLIARIAELASADVGAAYRITEKAKRYERIGEIKSAVIAQLKAELAEGSSLNETEAGEIFHNLESQIVRSRIIEGEPRIDGRDPEMIRALSVATGLLPRTHGSALFTRGETQALVTCTLGTARDAQTVDDLLSDKTDTFLFHYNFPPFSVWRNRHGRFAKTS